MEVLKLFRVPAYMGKWVALAEDGAKIGPKETETALIFEILRQGRDPADMVWGKIS